MTATRPIKLTVPAERGSVRLVRILAAGVAADTGLSIDDTEDLRIAVSELVALLVEGLDNGAVRADVQVDVEFRPAPGEVVVEGTRPAIDRHPDVVVHDLALEILRVVVDEHSFEADESGRRFRLVKRSRTGV